MSIHNSPRWKFLGIGIVIGIGIAYCPPRLTLDLSSSLSSLSLFSQPTPLDHDS
jgi:hypothetical protein